MPGTVSQVCTFMNQETQKVPCTCPDHDQRLLTSFRSSLKCPTNGSFFICLPQPPPSTPLSGLTLGPAVDPKIPFAPSFSYHFVVPRESFIAVFKSVSFTSSKETVFPAETVNGLKTLT